MPKSHSIRPGSLHKNGSQSTYCGLSMALDKSNNYNRVAKNLNETPTCIRCAREILNNKKESIMIKPNPICICGAEIEPDMLIAHMETCERVSRERVSLAPSTVPYNRFLAVAGGLIAGVAAGALMLSVALATMLLLK